MVGLTESTQYPELTPSAFGEKRIAEIALNTANSAAVLARVTWSLAVEDSFT
jgi:hypothetical protein